MEQHFQTSFIPKKPIVKDSSRSSKPVGILMVISIIVFFTMLLSLGGLYFYKEALITNIKNKEENLNKADDRFESTRITDLQRLDKRLRAANEVLSNHIAISPIFKDLGDITMKTVRYTSFGYDLDDKDNSNIVINLSGQAIGYRSIALQSDLFAKNENFINPIFSNLNLDDEGNVLFDLVFSVDPQFVDYKQTIQTSNEDSVDYTVNSTNNDVSEDIIPINNEINMGG